jgi:hypothetical protein
MGQFSDEEAKPYLLRTKKHLECLVCGFDQFYSRKSYVRTGLPEFFNMEGATANCSVCGRCGHIHWFLPVP